MIYFSGRSLWVIGIDRYWSVSLEMRDFNIMMDLKVNQRETDKSERVEDISGQFQTS